MTENDEQLNVPELIQKYFGVKVSCTLKRLFKKGWFYQCRSDVFCPQCNSVFLDIFRMSYHTNQGEYFYKAFACLKCAEIKVPNELPEETLKSLKKYRNCVNKDANQPEKRKTQMKKPSKKKGKQPSIVQDIINKKNIPESQRRRIDEGIGGSREDWYKNRRKYDG